MNNINKKLEQEVNALLAEGLKMMPEIKKAVLAKNTANTARFDFVSYASWITRLGQVIRKLYPPDSQQFVNYEEALTSSNGLIWDFWRTDSRFVRMVGIAQSIKHEIDNGLLGQIKPLLQADIFADLIEMSEELLAQGYYPAAAVLLGAVLEDTLRKLCDSHDIETLKDNRKPKALDMLNADLKKANVYNSLVQKQVTAWADLRNNAAHGHNHLYKKSDVKDMLFFVRNFTAEYLT